MWRPVSQVAWLLALLPSCGSALVIHVHAPRPAAIPARAFPVVCIAGAADDESRDIAAAIADHLEGSATRVVRTVPERLLLAAATQTSPALALLVNVALAETLTTQMSQVPALHCETMTACYGYPERTPVDVRVEVGDLLVRAFDPRSAAEMGRASRHAEESEPSPIAARLEVIERLRAMAVALVDVSDEMLDLELDDTSDEAARAAIERARAGEVHQAWLALDARLADASLDPLARSAIAFDRAQLLRADVDQTAADPVDEERARLADAEAQLLAVVQAAPDERHERALNQLRADRAAREDVRTQQTATIVNFGPTHPP